MVQIKFLYFLFALMTLVVLGSHVAEADCMSGRYEGPCFWLWNTDTCRRICQEEGRVSGHCSPALACWCEGC